MKWVRGVGAYWAGGGACVYVCACVCVCFCCCCCCCWWWWLWWLWWCMCGGAGGWGTGEGGKLCGEEFVIWEESEGIYDGMGAGHNTWEERRLYLMTGYARWYAIRGVTAEQTLDDMIIGEEMWCDMRGYEMRGDGSRGHAVEY